MPLFFGAPNQNIIEISEGFHCKNCLYFSQGFQSRGSTDRSMGIFIWSTMYLILYMSDTFQVVLVLSLLPSPNLHVALS